MSNVVQMKEHHAYRARRVAAQLQCEFYRAAFLVPSLLWFFWFTPFYNNGSRTASVKK